MANTRSSLGPSHAEEWASLCELGLITTCFVPRTYHIYPGYLGHGCPSLSWPWQQAFRSLENQPLLLCVHIGCHGCWCGQLLPSVQGLGRPPQDVSKLFCMSSSEPTTTWSSPGDLVHNHVQLCAAHTCAGRGNYGRRHLQLLPSPSSTPFPSPLPFLLLSHSGLKDRTGSSSS